MLSKVLKYDLKYMYKMLVIFYIFTLLFAGMTRLLWLFDGSAILHFIGDITDIITICMMFGIIFYNVMRAWMRFWNNIYKDESYLTHTLPITKNTIYASKFLATCITLATSIAVIIIALLIAYYSKENMELLKNSLDGLAEVYDSTAIGILLTMFLVFFLELLAAVLAGFTGLLLGQRSHTSKTVKSIILGFACYIGSSLILLGIVFILGFFVKDIMNLFMTDTMPSVEIIKSILLGAIGLYGLLVLIYYAIDMKIFKKGINVD